MPAITAATWVAIGALAVSAAGAYVSYQQGQKSARQQKQAQAVSQAEQQAQVAAQRKQQVRQERIRKAEILSSSTLGGTGMSSGQIDSTSDIGSLVDSNLGNLSRNENSATQYLNFSQEAANSASNARTFSAISSLAGGVSSFALKQPGAQRDMANIFG